MWQPPLQELVVAVKPARVVSNHHAHRFGRSSGPKGSLPRLAGDVTNSLSYMFRHLQKAVTRRPTSISVVSSRRSFSFTSRKCTTPNAPIDLDPSLRELLRDVDLSLLKHKTRRGSTGLTETPSHRELEVFPNDPSPDVDYLTAEELDGEVESNEKEHRKSPAALFGSLRIGAVILPLELQGAITKLIAGASSSIS